MHPVYPAYPGYPPGPMMHPSYPPPPSVHPHPAYPPYPHHPSPPAPTTAPPPPSSAPSAPAESSGVPYIGCQLSLINKRGVRYTGTLYTLNPADATVVLSNVRCHGTEGRAEPPIVPVDEIFAYMNFKGDDIADLHVVQTPPTNKPAPAAAAQPIANTAPPSQPVKEENPPADDKNVSSVSEEQTEAVAADVADDRSESTDDQSNEDASSDHRSSHARFARGPPSDGNRGPRRWNRGGGGGGGHHNGGFSNRRDRNERNERSERNQGGQDAKKSSFADDRLYQRHDRRDRDRHQHHRHHRREGAFGQDTKIDESTPDFDFETANARLEMDREINHDNAAAVNAADASVSVPEYSLPVAHDKAAPAAEPKYNAQKSFYDNLSRDRGQENRSHHSYDQRRVDAQTFGSSSVRDYSHHQGGGHRGRHHQHHHQGGGGGGGRRNDNWRSNRY